jgi:hypothetical protein
MSDPRIHACRQYAPFTIVSCVPDYCYTPIGAAVVVCPYNLIAEGELLSGTSSDVKFTSKFAGKADSVIPICQGDNQGTLGGVISGTFMGKCEYLQVKNDVQINSQKATGQTMVSWMNNQNTIGINKDVSGPLGIGGDVLSVVKGAMEKMADVINKNLAESKQLYKAFDADGHWAGQAAKLGKLAKGANAAGLVLDGASFLTAENKVVEGMKKALEIAATVGLAAAGVKGLPATLTVLSAKYTLQFAYDTLDSLEKERQQKVVGCTNNNPANASACSQAYGYPAVNYPVPRGFGFGM